MESCLESLHYESLFTILHCRVPTIQYLKRPAHRVAQYFPKTKFGFCVALLLIGFLWCPYWAIFVGQFLQQGNQAHVQSATNQYANGCGFQSPGTSGVDWRSQYAHCHYQSIVGHQLTRFVWYCVVNLQESAKSAVVVAMTWSKLQPAASGTGK